MKSIKALNDSIKDFEIALFSQARPKTMREVILDRFFDRAEWTADDLHKALPDLHRGSLWAMLSIMTNEGDIKRISFGHYSLKKGKKNA